MPPLARQAIIWKFDRHATHDGPGIRTAVYFKGCPLRCKWCSNPEGQSARPDLVLVGEKCDGCGNCVRECPTGALSLRRNEGNAPTLGIDRSKCSLCDVCSSTCPTAAVQVWGKAYSVPDLLTMLSKDRSIHRKSGGGVTCTGGEALMQSGFLREFLEACRGQGIHTAVETSACAGEEAFSAIVSLVDYLFIDLKHMRSETHMTLTGTVNDGILRNARIASSILRSRNKPLVIRMVVVPGVNDEDNVLEFADFLSGLPHLTTVELLPYHRFGTYKYDLLGRAYSLADVEPPTVGAMETWRNALRSRGIAVG